MIPVPVISSIGALIENLRRCFAAAWVSGRAFAWVDDEITDAGRAWMAARHRGPALLHRVDSRSGPGVDDFAVLTEWAASLE